MNVMGRRAAVKIVVVVAVIAVIAVVIVEVVANPKVICCAEWER